MTVGVQKTCLVALAAAILATILIAGPVHAAAPLEVDAVKSSRSLPDTLEVVGVVAKRNSATGTFSLIDREEFRKCRSAGCAKFLLPVRWNGKLPPVLSIVKVKGAVRDTKEGKFLFAESVEAVGR